MHQQVARNQDDNESGTKPLTGVPEYQQQAADQIVECNAPCEYGPDKKAFGVEKIAKCTDLGVVQPGGRFKLISLVMHVYL